MSNPPPEEPPFAFETITGHVPYASFTYASRPTSLTVIAILGIIVASFGLLSGFMHVIMANGLRMTTRVTQVAAPPPSQPLSVQEFTDYQLGSGYSAANRKIILDALSASHPLTLTRLQNADALLADAGEQIFNIPSDQVTSQRVTQLIVDAKTVASDSSSSSDDLFNLSIGQLRLSDKSATFFPTGNSPGISVENGSFTDSSGSRLAISTVVAVVDRAQQLSGNTLTSGDKATISTFLQSPNQTLITPGSPQQAAAQVKSIQRQPYGSLVLTTNQGNAPIWNFNQNQFHFHASAISSGVTSMYLAEGLLSLLVAGLLLTACILILRNSLFARKLALIYCVSKVPIAAFESWSTYLVTTSIMGSFTGSGIPFNFAAIEAVFVFAISLIFPIILLIIMCLPRVREYYRAKAVGQAF